MIKAISVQRPIWLCKQRVFGKVAEKMKEILDVNAINILELGSKTDP